ncbi:MAG TPA: ABC transporter substrate-binding protein [Actinomycetota bacterium]
MRKLIGLVAVVALSVTGAPADVVRPIEVGAVYPTRGGQGPGGLDEFRGVALAAEWTNLHGGIGGRPVAVRLEPADAADHAPAAVQRLAARGIQAILGSHGSTMSRPAAETAESLGRVFWETGAVGDLGMRAMEGERVFRFAPTGDTLGRSAVRFAREVLLPKLGRDPDALRYAVTYVDDAYGESVGRGALAEIADAGLPLSGAFPYPPVGADYAGVAARIKAADTDVLFVSAYLEDGIALRREQVRQGLPLVASVGTSSSYCMHLFGQALGEDAVGLFASDKPDGEVLDPSSLDPAAAAAFEWARARFRARYDHELTAGALTGFAGALALFTHVMPAARDLSADAIAEAARSVSVPLGSLPNGAGLEFGSSVDNHRALSVIWEWVEPGRREVVWPKAFATHEVVALPI